MLIGELVGRALWACGSSEYLRFVGAMLATGCTVGAVVLWATRLGR